MPQARPNWEVYERMVARLMSDTLRTDLCVTPNAKVLGVKSGVKRQIDVLIDARHETDNTRRIIVDAKRRTRKIDVTDVEAFLGLMEDVGATHGYLVCPTGHTPTAERRAQDAVTIALVPLDHLGDFDPATWPKCMNSRCHHGRIFWTGYPEIYMTGLPLDARISGGPRRLSFVHHVGKCDRCGRFHVQCTTCEEILSLPEDDDNDIGHQCSCRPPWFWIASIETDNEGNRSAELHGVWGIDQYLTVDRRPC
ncbi:restriction endonuclease [Bosea sp. AK1]|uniref:restriction endonuclease n=1 Tax=Bosea sp. AK1 TaxID=2587160 RepID=UPI00114EB7FD|nr:restriction endonuclease [Bosea sp. AK1]TQI75332.1 restriction endonuclease [Bosea sp. AK1]